MKRSFTRMLAAFALAAPAATALAQKVVNLPKPDAEFTDPFTSLGSVRELKDGRVIVNDRRDKTLQLIDLKGGNATKIGREGQGPGEYALPMVVVPMPGDSTALYDPLNSRYLMIGPDGKVAKEFRLEETTSGGGRGGRGGPGGIRIGGAPPKGTDARGRIYYEGQAFRDNGDGPPMVSDTAAIVRYDRATKKSDTVAWAHLPPNNVKISGGPNNRSVMIGNSAFAARDDWAVTPDGRVGVVRVADNHVDWYAAGAKKSGPAVKFDRMPVTEGDKVEYRAARKSGIGMRMTVENGRSSASMGPPPDMPDPEWPEYKPPFPQNAAFARPNGELWVLRTRKAGDKIPTFNVFDAQGKLMGVVALPAGTRLVGFGNQTLYAVRVDADDLQYLQRYRLSEAMIAP